MQCGQQCVSSEVPLLFVILWSCFDSHVLPLGDDPNVWPLPAEVSTCMTHWTTGVVFIDDFVVPGTGDLYGIDAPHYNMQVCSRTAAAHTL